MSSKNIIELKSFFDGGRTMNNKWCTQILYSLDKRGSRRIWIGYVIIVKNSGVELDKENWINSYELVEIDFNSKLHAVYFTSSQKTGGKIMTSAPTTIIVGKNIGRKNETTPFQQALSHIMSEYNKKTRGGATPHPLDIIENVTFETLISRDVVHPNRVNVMALHDVKQHWNRVTYPCYVQPKLDGIHIVANAYKDTIDLYSRGLSKQISQNHIREALSFLTREEWRGWYVTGEMWREGMKRQDITSIVGQENDHNIKERLPLNVFDVFCVDKPQLEYSERYTVAQQIVELAASPYIRLVEADIVTSRDELDKYYNMQLEAGMEGVIIRIPSALYEFGVTSDIRSFGVLKYKPRQDSEFCIVGFKEGKGKMVGAIIFIASCDAGKFSVIPKWPMEERREAYKKGDTYIGRMATISYDTLSDKGLPIQPVLIAFIE